jgi:flagellar basal-body rod protein FlgF
MLRGLYTAAAGMISQQRKHDTATNNIANLNTPGFKMSTVVSRSFPEMLIHLVNGGNPDAKRIGRLHAGVFAEENIALYQQGDLQETGNLADMALVSDIQVPGVQFDASGKAVSPEGETLYRPQAFFAVLDLNGQERYTRNGKFSLNSAGELVTSEGYRVLGSNGEPIAPGRDITAISVTPTGQLADAATGQPLLSAAGEPIALRIARIDNPHLMTRAGNGVFRLDDEAEPARNLEPNDQVRIAQGFIERSNVDPGQSMVELMSALRAYEANQKIVQYYDRSMEKAVNEVGRV